jgi:beta-lactamase regulating signal transducer with metallopeptidase domain
MNPLISLDPAVLIAAVLNLLLPLTAVCLVALIAVRRLLRHRPSLRYLLCLAGLIGILFSPFIVCVRQEWGGSLVTLSLPRIFSLLSAPHTGGSPALRVAGGASGGCCDTPLLQMLLWWCVGAGMFLWIAGVGWGAVRLARGWIEVSRLTHNACPWNAPAHAEALDQLEQILGCPIPPIFTSLRVTSPVAVGLFRPVVILPEGLAETLTPVQLRQVLLHECAHIAFRHILGGVVERVVALLLWPHPLVRALCRELARAREEVCDNVASQEDGAACYARTLFAMAQGKSTAPQTASALALLGPETSLEARITGLLDPRRDRMVRVKRGTWWAALYVTVLVLASTVAVRVVASNVTPLQEPVRAFETPDTLFLKRMAEAKARQTGGNEAPDSGLLAAKREAEAKEMRNRGGTPVELRRIDEHLFEVWRDGKKIGQVEVPYQPAPRMGSERHVEAANPEDLERHRKAEMAYVAKVKEEARQTAIQGGR